MNKHMLQPLDLSWPWRLLIFLQAGMVAWIGFTHGSGLELYLFKFSTVSYKSVFTWDHNLATVVALLGILMLWRALPLTLVTLSLIYLVGALLLSRYGGFVDDPYPLMGGIASIVLPLAVWGLRGPLWITRITQVAIFLSLAYWIGICLNAPPFFLDQVFAVSSLMGSPISETAGQTTLMTFAIVLTASYFFERPRWLRPSLLFLFATLLASIHLIQFGMVPEALLKFALPFLVVCLAESSKREKDASAQ